MCTQMMHSAAGAAALYRERERDHKKYARRIRSNLIAFYWLQRRIASRCLLASREITHKNMKRDVVM